MMAVAIIAILICVIAGLIVGMAAFAARRSMKDESFYTHRMSERAGRWDKRIEGND